MRKRVLKHKLRSLDVRPRRERGQNFMLDEFALQRIVEFGQPDQGMPIVEIGPGLGALTAYLADYPNVSLIELEQAFCEQLRTKYPQLNVINQDVRLVDFSQFGDKIFVFGNLPYSFSTDIVFHLLESSNVVARAVLMLQREFVERMSAAPGSRTYGKLSITVQAWADLRLGPVIPGDSFHPKAKVDSQLVELKLHHGAKYGLSDLDRIWLRRVVQAAFFKRRKKLLNSMRSSGVLQTFDIGQVLELVGIDPETRAETIGVGDYLRLARAFSEREQEHQRQRLFIN